MIYMTLNQLLVINISLYIMSDMYARYARVSPISPPDIRYPIWKTHIWYNSDIRYL